jgi:hypothetical protein
LKKHNGSNPFGVDLCAPSQKKKTLFVVHSSCWKCELITQQTKNVISPVMSASEPQIAVEWIGFCSSLFRIQVINKAFVVFYPLLAYSTDDYLSGLLV